MESSHREGLIAFVVTEVLTEASRLQTASVEVSGAQAYTNQQVMDEFSRKLVECITDKPKDQVLITHTDSCLDPLEQSRICLLCPCSTTEW